MLNKLLFQFTELMGIFFECCFSSVSALFFLHRLLNIYYIVCTYFFYLYHNMEYENVFGEGIPFHEGKPIQLLNYAENEKNRKEFGEIIFNEEALDIIRE